MFRLFVALFMLFPVIASASPSWTKRYTVDFRLGDSDSRLDARHSAIEDIKLQAAAESETYVHSTLTYDSGELKESEQMVSASMVLLNNIEETFGLTSSGQQVLTLSADATLDDRLLDRRIDALIEKESRMETAARRNNGDSFMPSYAPDTQPSSAAPVTVYDELSSYSKQTFEENEVGKESISLESFTTSVSDSEFQFFLEKQLIPRITEKGVSINPSSVREDERGLHISFFLDWELPIRALRDQVRGHLDLREVSGGHKQPVGYKFDLEEARSDHSMSADSRFYADLLAEWRGDLVVHLTGESDISKEVYRAPFWFATNYGSCEVSMETQVEDNGQRARKLCIVNNEDRNEPEWRQPEHLVMIHLSHKEYDEMQGMTASIEWKK